MTYTALILAIVSSVIWTCGLGMLWILFCLLAVLLLPFAVLLGKYCTEMFKIMVTDLLHLDTFYDREGYAFMVAECCQGKVVGFVGVHKINEESAELVHMYVHPSHRGRGLAMRLVQEVEKFCASQSYKNVMLYSLERNRPARRLYEKCGYKYIESVSYPNIGALCVLMECAYIKPLHKRE